MANPDKCPRCGSKHIRIDKSGAGNTWRAWCNDCHKAWPYQQTHFNGELMTCALCGKQEQHVVGKDTHWRFLELEDAQHYVCTDHFPPDGSDAQQFQWAYEDVILTLTRKAEDGKRN